MLYRNDYPRFRPAAAVNNKALRRRSELRVQSAQSFPLVRRIHEEDMHV